MVQRLFTHEIRRQWPCDADSLGTVVGSNATRSMSYTSDQYGQVLRRKTLGKGNLEVAQRFYYLNGHTIGGQQRRPVDHLVCGRTGPGEAEVRHSYTISAWGRRRHAGHGA